MSVHGRVVVHIGVPKTATTAVQSALSAARADLADQGVVYPGKGLNHVPHVRAPLDWPADPAMAAADAEKWRRLCRRVERSERVVISAESLAVADDRQMNAIVDGLGGDRVEVVVTLRSLAAIVPAAYQEDVKAGVSTPYADWLDDVCAENGPQAAHPARFWGAHDHASIVERWARRVGAHAVTIVVVDPSRPDAVFRAFDEVIGAAPGTVDPSRAEHGNRSLTAGECELVRRLNEAVGSGDQLEIRRRPVPPLAVWAMIEVRRPAVSEPRLVLPGQAARRLAPTAVDLVDRIRTLGCRVLGDLDALLVDADRYGQSDDAAANPAAIDIEAVTLFVAWMLRNGVEPRGAR